MRKHQSDKMSYAIDDDGDTVMSTDYVHCVTYDGTPVQVYQFVDEDVVDDYVQLDATNKVNLVEYEGIDLGDRIVYEDGTCWIQGQYRGLKAYRMPIYHADVNKT